MPSIDDHRTKNFPRCLEEINSVWLASALDRDVVRFSSVDIGGGRGMMGDVWRLTVECRSGAQLTVVAKFASRDSGKLSVERRSRIFERELNFYESVAPTLSCRTPQIFGQWLDPSTAEFLLLMEYLPSNPAVSQLGGVPLAESRAVMDEVAALHSVKLDKIPSTANLTPLCSLERCHYQMNFVRDGWSTLLSLMEVEGLATRSANSIASRVSDAYGILANQPLVLCHADVRPDNIIFDPNSTSVTLIDWQGVAFGPRAWDIGYFLAQGLMVEDRRKWFDELIAHYLSQSSGNAVPANRDRFIDTVHKMGWYSLAIACSLFSLSDGEAIRTRRLAKSMGERAVALLVDAGEW